MPDEAAKEQDLVARDMAKVSSYLLNMYCKNSNILNKDCVKFMSEYSPPSLSELGRKCLSTDSVYSSYRRILPPSYKDGVQRVNQIYQNQFQNKLLLFFQRFELPFQEKICRRHV